MQRTIRTLICGAILFLIGVQLTAGAPCPYDWRQSGDWCYMVNVSSTLSFAGAQVHCQEHGGQLADIRDRRRLLDINDLIRVNPSTNWWINVKLTSGTTKYSQLPPEVLDNFGDDKVVKDASGTSQCAHISSIDGLFYWSDCEAQYNYVCERPTERVDVQLVTPDDKRPDPSWFAQHGIALEEALHQALADSLQDDDKGTYSATKATATPIPPSTTPAPSTTASTAAPGGGGGAVTLPPTQATTASLCQDSNWRTLDAKCYQLFLEAKNWTAARDYCQYQGGNLATFSTADVQRDFLSGHNFNTGSVWIGLTRGGGQVTWVTGDVPNYSSWTPGQPDGANPQQQCGALALHTGKWSDESCAAFKPFVCERSLSATSRATPATVAPTPAVSQCGEAGWWLYGSFCYLLVNQPPALTWHAAQLACRNRSANLARIDNFATNSNILAKVTSSGLPVWIGLSKLQTPPTFRWVDGTTSTYIPWAGNHSSSAGDMASCVRMNTEHGYWSAVNCNLPQYYVCRRPRSGGAPAPTPPLPPPRSACPPDWQKYGADRCLRLHKESAGWQQARSKCLTEQGDLLSVGNPTQQAFLTAAIKDSVRPVWIGLTYLKEEHRFPTWTDESAFNYTYWAPGQPTTVCDACPAACGIASGGRGERPGSWKDVDCSQRFGFICQRPAIPDNSNQPNTSQQYCDPPRSDHVKVGNVCLKVVRQATRWMDAVEKCQTMNSSLAYVHDVFDNAELIKLLYRDAGARKFWIGLSDTANYGTQEWTSPWPATPTYSNWDTAHGHRSVRNSCTVLDPATGLWQAQACTDPFPFVCMHAPTKEWRHMSSDRCPSRQWFGSDTKCYILKGNNQDTKTWLEAKQSCEKLGYQLAVVTSESDLVAIREITRSMGTTSSAWIGLKQQTDGGYQWVDGSEVTFKAWNDGEPSSSREACVEASRLSGGHWNDVSCNMYRPYICMADIGAGGPSPTAAASVQQATSGWGVFGIVVLMLALVAAVAVAAVYTMRRWRPGWMPSTSLLRGMSVSGRRAHHSVENLAYSHRDQTLGAESGEAGVEASNSEPDGSVLNKWGSQERLVDQDGL